MAGILAQALLGGIAETGRDWQRRLKEKRNQAFVQQGWDREDANRAIDMARADENRKEDIARVEKYREEDIDRQARYRKEDRTREDRLITEEREHQSQQQAFTPYSMDEQGNLSKVTFDAQGNPSAKPVMQKDASGKFSAIFSGSKTGGSKTGKSAKDGDADSKPVNIKIPFGQGDWIEATAVKEGGQWKIFGTNARGEAQFKLVQELYNNPPQEAVDMLLSGQITPQRFDAVYGAGASETYRKIAESEQQGPPAPRQQPSPPQQPPPPQQPEPGLIRQGQADSSTGTGSTLFDQRMAAR